jgi:hypothetical protein
MANVRYEYVFALGSESATRLRSLLAEVRPAPGLKVGRLGADLIGTRSDYGPFRDRRVPFLFFSTGQHPDYHQTTDLPERIDYRKLQRVSDWIGDLTWRLANDDDAPAWTDQQAPDLAEVRTLLRLLTRVLERPRAVRLSEAQRARLGDVAKRLKEMLARGRVTATERTWLVWTARLMLVTVF